MNTRQTAILATATATYAAMMAANAAEDLAPQDDVYGMLADALRATLRTFYRADDDAAVRYAYREHADGAYGAALMSGEFNADTVALPEPAAAAETTDTIAAVNLTSGDIMVDPAGNLRVSDVRTLPSGTVVLTITAMEGSYVATWTFHPAERVTVLCG